MLIGKLTLNKKNELNTLAREKLFFKSFVSHQKFPSGEDPGLFLHLSLEEKRFATFYKTLVKIEII